MQLHVPAWEPHLEATQLCGARQHKPPPGTHQQAAAGLEGERGDARARLVAAAGDGGAAISARAVGQVPAARQWGTGKPYCQRLTALATFLALA